MKTSGKTSLSTGNEQRKNHQHLNPQVFDKALCCEQLRHSGLTATARIRRAGYPLRWDFSSFTGHFRVLVTQQGLTDTRAAGQDICREFLDSSDYRLGRTRVFLKERAGRILERQRAAALEARALLIQRQLRMWIVRKRYVRVIWVIWVAIDFLRLVFQIEPAQKKLGNKDFILINAFRLRSSPLYTYLA